MSVRAYDLLLNLISEDNTKEMTESERKKPPKPRRTGQRMTVGKDKHLIWAFLDCDANGAATELTEGDCLAGKAGKARPLERLAGDGFFLRGHFQGHFHLIFQVNGR